MHYSNVVFSNVRVPAMHEYDNNLQYIKYIIYSQDVWLAQAKNEISHTIPIFHNRSPEHIAREMSQPLTQPHLSFFSLESPPAETSYVNVDLTTGGESSTNIGELKLPPGYTSNGSCSNSDPNQFSNQLPYSNPPPFPPPPPPLYSEVPPGVQMQMQMPMPPPPPGFGPASASTMQPGPGGMFYYQPNAAAGNSNGINVVMVQQGAMMMGGPPSFIIPWPNLVIGTHFRHSVCY